MNAEAALQKQIERYRGMTGGQRLKIALDLHEKACKAARAEIRKQFPDATEAQLGSKFREWLAREQAAERAELGKQGY